LGTRKLHAQVDSGGSLADVKTSKTDIEHITEEHVEQSSVAEPVRDTAKEPVDNTDQEPERGELP